MQALSLYEAAKEKQLWKHRQSGQCMLQEKAISGMLTKSTDSSMTLLSWL